MRVKSEGEGEGESVDANSSYFVDSNFSGRALKDLHQSSSGYWWYLTLYGVMMQENGSICAHPILSIGGLLATN